MYIDKVYKVDGIIQKEPPLDPEVKYDIYFELGAREGYILQHIFFPKQRARQLLEPAGSEMFWREVLLDEVK